MAKPAAGDAGGERQDLLLNLYGRLDRRDEETPEGELLRHSTLPVQGGGGPAGGVPGDQVRGRE